MLVWRIAREEYKALDGEGARLNGGRWNSEGIPVVYASASLSLAGLEYLVHVDPEDVPGDLVAMKIEVPDDVALEQVEIDSLPKDWQVIAEHPACVAAGDAWAVHGRTAVLSVPSAIIPEERNYLLNPRHAEATRFAIRLVRGFAFDRRLLP